MSDQGEIARLRAADSANSYLYRHPDGSTVELVDIGAVRAVIADAITPWVIGQCSPVYLSPENLDTFAKSLRRYVQDAISGTVR